MDFIGKYNILAPEQFGFTTNSSTELAITTIYDKLLDDLEKNQYTCATFLHIKKAFDSLDHKLLTLNQVKLLEVLLYGYKPQDPKYL